MILARPVSRDGEIVMRGHMLGGSARKISRTARSTLAGEAIALANAIDSSLWLQAMMIEIYLAVVSSFRISQSDPLPLNTPFKICRQAPSAMDSKQGSDRFDSHELDKTRQMASVSSFSVQEGVKQVSAGSSLSVFGSQKGSYRLDPQCVDNVWQVDFGSFFHVRKASIDSPPDQVGNASIDSPPDCRYLLLILVPMTVW